MSNAIRSIALAAALVGLAPMAANAAPLVFKQVSTFSLVNDSTHTNGDAISKLSDGITISGAELYVGTGADEIALTFLNDTDPIKILIDSSKVHINALTLTRFSDKNVDVAVDGDSAQSLGGTGGAWVPAALKRFCSPTAPCADEQLLTDTVDTWISELTFTQSSGDFVGLNNLAFMVASSGGVAPEPASYGLAAVALIAAGAASRRRKQG